MDEWILLIGIFVLSLILALVVGSFTGTRGRRIIRSGGVQALIKPVKDTRMGIGSQHLEQESSKDRASPAGQALRKVLGTGGFALLIGSSDTLDSKRKEGPGAPAL